MHIDIVGESVTTAYRRVVRQLLEALIFEGVLVPRHLHEQWFVIEGVDRDGNQVLYKFSGQIRFTFGRLTLTEQPVIRESRSGSAEAGNITQLLNEVFHPESGLCPILPSFHEEMKRTVVHEMMIQELRAVYPLTFKEATYVQLECAGQGHPYHPCFKSRIGFSEEDNAAYAPEYEPLVNVFWLAVHRVDTVWSLEQESDWNEFILSVLTPTERSRFEAHIAQLGLELRDYYCIPVHPWQWSNYLNHVCQEAVRQLRLIPLGVGETTYTPQQSIRTLSCVSGGRMLDLKLSLHITNTSSKRDLNTPTVVAAPVISNWLQAVVDRDEYLKKEAKLILLHELAGISYVPAGGTAGAIWREHIYTYLEPGEEAVPCHVLMNKDDSGLPLVHPWIAEYGLEEWFTEWVRTNIIPVVHLLVARGIVLESHAQNMIMVHRNGWPVRTAWRDFHEGVEYYAPFIADPDLVPDFAAIHPSYASASLGDYCEMPDLLCLREMIIDCLLFMNVGYFIMDLVDEYSVPELERWSIVAEELESYIRRHPALQQRFEALDLFGADCNIEALAQQRMWGKVLIPPRRVLNPLYAARVARNLGIDKQ